MILLHAKPRPLFLMHLCTHIDSKLLAPPLLPTIRRKGILVARKLRNRQTTFWRYPRTSWDGCGHACSGRAGQLDWRGRVYARHGCLVRSIPCLSPLVCWSVWSVT